MKILRRAESGGLSTTSKASGTGRRSDAVPTRLLFINAGRPMPNGDQNAEIRPRRAVLFEEIAADALVTRRSIKPRTAVTVRLSSSSCRSLARLHKRDHATDDQSLPGHARRSEETTINRYRDIIDDLQEAIRNGKATANLRDWSPLQGGEQQSPVYLL